MRKEKSNSKNKEELIKVIEESFNDSVKPVFGIIKKTTNLKKFDDDITVKPSTRNTIGMLKDTVIWLHLFKRDYVDPVVKIYNLVTPQQWKNYRLVSFKSSDLELEEEKLIKLAIKKFIYGWKYRPTPIRRIYKEGENDN